MSKITKSLDVYGMHCKSCEDAIEYEIKNLKGVIKVDANSNNSTVIISYENEFCDEHKIRESIKKSGYSTKDNSVGRFFGLGIIIIAMLFLSNNSLFGFDTNSMLKEASLFMIFIVGVLSSLHCVGMCGGIMLTQTLDKDNLLLDKKSSLKVSLKYNFGRVISYTILGGLIGSLGSIFSLSMKSQGFIQILAAFFMIISGLNMIGFKLFKNIKFSIPFFNKRCNKNIKSPFIVGILNGFMPCGPLQTMQLYALATGSFVMGALSMFIFSLGTVPLMLGFGYISSLLSKSLSNKIFKYSGIFIIILGLSMGQRGLALSGFNLPLSGLLSFNNAEAPIVDGYQEVTITANRYGYSSSSNAIKGDIPVKLTIKVEELTNCNSTMYFSGFNQYLDLSNGDIIAEINPNGQDISFTCWMGMLRDNLRVI